jgi:heterotetrameric sarcosine oxidase delta subunit
MIRIACPHCGPRDHAEFTYIGDATKIRPADPANASEAEWFDYIYIRDNPRGPHQEYWQHIQGCRAFVKVLRDTLTHEILATGLPKDTLKPAGSGEAS